MVTVRSLGRRDTPAKFGSEAKIAMIVIKAANLAFRSHDDAFSRVERSPSGNPSARAFWVY